MPTPGDGTDAAAAGMALVPGSTPANTIDTELIKSRDYIANAYTYWKPGVVIPQSRGGLGATTAATQRTALGLPAAGAAEAATPSTLAQRYSDGTIDAVQFATASDPTLPNHCTRRAWVESYVASAVGSGYLPLTGGTVTGHIWVPNSTAASSGYTVAYINGDGRISRGASALKYKKNVSAVDPDSLGDIFPTFHRWQMRADGMTPADSTWRYGPIADYMLEHPDQAPFVVVLDGEAESIDFIGLLMAQVAQLHARVEALEAG